MSQRHLRPKLRFIKHTLINCQREISEHDEKIGRKGQTLLTDIGKQIPPQYWGSRLEKVVAPR